MSESSPRRSKRRKLDHDAGSEGSLKKSAKAVAKETAQVAEQPHKNQRTEWMSGVRVPDLIRPKSSYKADTQNGDWEVQSEQAVLKQTIVRGAWFV